MTDINIKHSVNNLRKKQPSTYDINVGVIVPADNNSVVEDLQMAFKDKYNFIVYKMEKTGNTGHPENDFEYNRFINDLNKAGEYFIKNNVKYIVYGRGYGTYNESGRKNIINILKKYANEVILPTEEIIKKIDLLGINKISLILPYTEDRGVIDVKMFLEKNINIDHVFYLNENDGEKISKITGNEILNLCRQNLDKLMNSKITVIQCTALHTVGIIESLRNYCGREIISSNSVIVDYLKSVLPQL